ncbi:hypothetical protein T08_13966 [Trichinella sp. T8]|nr:hypothetical protein T08_13966 [Trichinella sp. T8]
MECNRQSHLKSNSANQCAIIRGFALRLTLSWGKQTAHSNNLNEYKRLKFIILTDFLLLAHGIKTSQNPRAIKFEEDTRFSAMIM